MQEVPIVLGFTSGELTPWLSTRFDLQAYQRGALRISNFHILPYGGLQFRAGTAYLGESRSANSRLFGFAYAEDDTLMLEFYSGCMRVFKNGSPVQRGDEKDYVLTTPWTTEKQLETLHFTQVNDVVYICCPTYPPMLLSRYADDQWTLQEVNFDSYPREAHAQQEGTLAVLFEKGGLYANLTLSGGNMQFTSDMENKEYLLADASVPGYTLFANQFQGITSIPAPDLSTTGIGKGEVIRQKDDSSGLYHFYYCIRAYSSSSFNGSQLLRDYPHHFQAGIMRLPATGSPYEVEGDWEIITHGTWNAQWELWRSYDTPDMEADFRLWNWVCVKTFSQSDFETRQNWALSGSEPRPCRMVLVCRSCSNFEAMEAMLQFRSLGGLREFKFRITSVTDSTHAKARVMRKFLGNPVSFSTRSWSFGAIGVRNGYPAFSAMFQGRFWLGGMPGLPTTLLASAIDNFADFSVGSDDDSAMHLSIMDSDQSRICWLCATRQLLVGTSDSEWALVSSTGGGLTPSTVAFKRQSSVGSENLPARAVENTVLFVQRGGKRMREIAYRLESDGFTTTDISMLAEHLFHSGIKEWCVQRGAYFNIWVLLNDSSLAMLTINQEQQVTAWQRVELSGRRVLRMAALPSDSGGDDEIWFIVQMNNTGKTCIERLTAGAPHLDCFEECVSVRNMELKCGYHLHGIEIRVIDLETGTSGRCYGSSGGLRAIPFVVSGHRYRVGIPIFAELHTMPLEGAASFNSVRQFSRFKLRLLESDTDFEFRSSVQEDWERLEPGTCPEYGTSYTGAVRLSQMPDAAVGQSLCIRYSGTRDFRLLSITQEVDHHGK